VISDFRILGIDESADLAAIKSAFRRRAKELHPDLSPPEESLRRHDLFTQVCRAYRRLLAGAAEPSRTGSPRASAAASARAPRRGLELAPHADQAYVFYRQGMRLFMSIHPSRWKLEPGVRVNTRIAGHEEEQELVKARVMDLVRLFPRAYYYFSIVAHEYPDSEWSEDASRKMATIEERIGRYRKIIESFDSQAGAS
jgi:hypothetical protein